MAKALQLLILEDRPSDAELMVAELRHNGFVPEWRRVESEDEFREALSKNIDLILADYALPQYDALRALKLVQETGLDIPIIVVTGSVSEEIAVECMKQGAADYLIKDRLARLGPAATYALHQKELEKQKQQTETALQISEALNQAVLNSIKAHIAVLDDNGVIIAVNDAWDRFANENGDPGCVRTGVGQNYLAVCRKAAADGYPGAQQALDGITGVLSGEKTLYSAEYPAHSAWLKRWFSLDVTPLSLPHRGAVVTHLEITERKMGEERLHLQSAALEAIPTATVISDHDGRIVWVNPAFTHLTGYSSAEAIGRPSRLSSPGASSASLFRQMHETIRAGQVWRSEALSRRKDGSVYTGEITVAPVRDENGEIANFIDVEQDITERKQHERELEAIVVVANALRNAKTRSEMLPVILDQLLDLLNAEGASIALYDPTTDEMTVTLARGPFAGSSGAHFNAREGLTGVVINSRQIYLSPCPPEETVMAGQSFGHPYAIAGVPLITQEQLVGVIWLVRSTEINPTEARLLTAIADIAASAIYRASLYEETEQRLQRITALREIDKAITASLDLRVTLSVLVDQV
ncbi:MAG TPA: PAS domain S-box protein, partial [Anaerolineaceae bacterium]|nr:PAS domain S-box protein [Anaerolineaceae bacterium]